MICLTIKKESPLSFNTINMELLKNVYTREEAYEITDYPYWFRLKTSMFIWIEKNKNWHRICKQTINPKNGKENKVKKSVYYNYCRLYKDKETGYINTYCYNIYNYETFSKAMKLNIFETEQDIEKATRQIKTGLQVELICYNNYKYDEIENKTVEELNEMSEEIKRNLQERIELNHPNWIWL